MYMHMMSGFSGFQYMSDDLSEEDKITLCIIRNYLDFKVLLWQLYSSNTYECMAKCVAMRMAECKRDLFCQERYWFGGSKQHSQCRPVLQCTAVSRTCSSVRVIDTVSNCPFLWLPKTYSWTMNFITILETHK